MFEANQRKYPQNAGKNILGTLGDTVGTLKNKVMSPKNSA